MSRSLSPGAQSLILADALPPQIGVQVLHDVGTQVQAGMTTDDIDALVHQKCVELGAYPSPLRYKLFPKSCCTSLNEVVCHGIPDSTVLREGDIVNVDISIYYQGYHTDLNETWLIGQVDAQSKLLVDTTYQCLQEAIKIVKPGTMYREARNTCCCSSPHTPPLSR